MVVCKANLKLRVLMFSLRDHTSACQGGPRPWFQETKKVAEEEPRPGKAFGIDRGCLSVDSKSCWVESTPQNWWFLLI